MRLRSSANRAFTRPILVTVSALTLWGAIASAPAGAQGKPPAKPPVVKQPAPTSATACTQVSASTIAEAYGYKHVVSLRNSCDRAVECEVWTDVDPSPRHLLHAAKGESVDVITRIGSPASEFKAFKECRFR